MVCWVMRLNVSGQRDHFRRGPRRERRSARCSASFLALSRRADVPSFARMLKERSTATTTSFLPSAFGVRRRIKGLANKSDQQKQHQRPQNEQQNVIQTAMLYRAVS